MGDHRERFVRWVLVTLVLWCLPFTLYYGTSSPTGPGHRGLLPAPPVPVSATQGGQQLHAYGALQEVPPELRVKGEPPLPLHVSPNGKCSRQQRRVLEPPAQPLPPQQGLCP